MSHKGVLISFEGIDGSGKSTQARLLEKHLRLAGYDVVFIREPGGTPVSEAVREILLSRKNDGMSPRTELLLFLAARAELVEKCIIPALKNGKVVITDRFSDSTFAYQIYGRGLPDAKVRQSNAFAADNVRPDLTFLVDVDIAVAHTRIKQRPDRMEAAEGAFHRRVRRGFLELARKNKRRILQLNGRKSAQELWQEVCAAAEELLERRKISKAL
jgi:dTMP kinase